jgi:hypothetical protein
VIAVAVEGSQPQSIVVSDEPPAVIAVKVEEARVRVSNRPRIAKRSEALTLSFDVGKTVPPEIEPFQAPVFPQFPEGSGVSKEREVETAPAPLDFPDDFGIGDALRAIIPPEPTGVSVPEVDLQEPTPVEDVTSTQLWSVYEEFIRTLQKRK